MEAEEMILPNLLSLATDTAHVPVRSVPLWPSRSRKNQTLIPEGKEVITSGTTARLCYEALVQLGNHVDGLIWVSAGG